MDKDKPITDKDNFPAREEQVFRFVATEECAYLDGCSDGYRRAVADFMVWSVALLAVAILARSLAQE